VTQYLVKWEGYPDWESTWEPLESLKLAPKLLEEFEKKQQKQKSSYSRREGLRARR
jgi:hypothetical protein